MLVVMHLSMMLVLLATKTLLQVLHRRLWNSRQGMPFTTNYSLWTDPCTHSNSSAQCMLFQVIAICANSDKDCMYTCIYMAYQLSWVSTRFLSNPGGSPILVLRSFILPLVLDSCATSLSTDELTSSAIAIQRL